MTDIIISDLDTVAHVWDGYAVTGPTTEESGWEYQRWSRDPIHGGGDTLGAAFNTIRAGAPDVIPGEDADADLDLPVQEEGWKATISRRRGPGRGTSWQCFIQVGAHSSRGGYGEAATPGEALTIAAQHVLAGELEDI